MSIFLFNFWLHRTAYGISVLQPGIESMPPVVEAQGLNYQTTRDMSKIGISHHLKKIWIIISWHNNTCACFSCSVVSDSLWPHGCNSPGSPVHGILQARILEWVVISSSRGCSQPRDQTLVSCVSYSGRQILYTVPPGKPWRYIFICELTTHRRKVESDLQLTLRSQEKRLKVLLPRKKVLSIMSRASRLWLLWSCSKGISGWPWGAFYIRTIFDQLQEVECSLPRFLYILVLLQLAVGVYWTLLQSSF